MSPGFQVIEGFKAMSLCNICGEKIPEGSRTCSVCGSSVDEFLPTRTGVTPPPEIKVGKPALAGGSSCPACGKVYGPDHTDAFCACGTGLVKEAEAEKVSALAEVMEDSVVKLEEDAPPMAIVEEAPPLAPILQQPCCTLRP